MWRGFSAVSATLAPLLFFAGSAWAVELNEASQAELERLKGIGTSLSQKLLDARTERPFADWNDLLQRVPGVGVATARRLSAAGLTVRGAPYETVAPKSTR